MDQSDLFHTSSNPAYAEHTDQLKSEPAHWLKASEDNAKAVLYELAGETEWLKTLGMFYFMSLHSPAIAHTTRELKRTFRRYHIPQPANPHFCVYHCVQKDFIEHLHFSKDEEKTYRLTTAGAAYFEAFIQRKKKHTRPRKTLRSTPLNEDLTNKLDELLLKQEKNWLHSLDTIEEKVLGILFLVKMKLQLKSISAATIHHLMTVYGDPTLSQRSVQAALSRTKPLVEKIVLDQKPYYRLSRKGLNVTRKSMQTHLEQNSPKES